MKRLVALAIGLMLMMSVPSAALASGGSSCASYNHDTCNIISNDNATGTLSGTAATTTSAGSLPFTGLNLALLAAGGFVLVGAGLAVRRLSSPTE